MQNKNNKQKACPQCLKHSFCKRGFTIIETMISVSLFIVVVMAGMGALLNANLLQQKSQNMRSIIDNLSFIMEDMSRNLRTGYNYHCIDNNDPSITTPPHSCTSNGGGIAFEWQNGDKDDPGDQWVYYIGSCNGGKSGICKSVDGGSSFVQLVPDEVYIGSASSFTVSGAESPLVTPYNYQQPFVTIKLVGTITYRPGTSNIVTPFSLQTSVSQRKMDRGL